MGWIGCVRCEKSRRDFVARTIALIAPVLYILQQDSCIYESIPNAPKYYKPGRNISLGSSGVDGVRWLRKITTRFHGTNFCLIAPVLSALKKFHAVTKRSQMHRNTRKRTETLV